MIDCVINVKDEKKKEVIDKNKSDKRREEVIDRNESDESKDKKT